ASGRTPSIWATSASVKPISQPRRARKRSASRTSSGKLRASGKEIAMIPPSFPPLSFYRARAFITSLSIYRPEVIMLGYIRRTTKTGGLTVTAVLDEDTYPKGQKVTRDEIQGLKLKRHEVCPAWNYTISPMHAT